MGESLFLLVNLSNITWSLMEWWIQLWLKRPYLNSEGVKKKKKSFLKKTKNKSRRFAASLKLFALLLVDVSRPCDPTVDSWHGEGRQPTADCARYELAEAGSSRLAPLPASPRASYWVYRLKRSSTIYGIIGVKIPSMLRAASHTHTHTLINHTPL